MCFFKKVFLFIVPIVLTSCSFFSPVNINTTEYELNAVPEPVIKRSISRPTLLVSVPEASSMFNTQDMAYSTKRYQISYFSKNRWADTPPHMLQSLMIQTLQKTHYFRAVEASGVRYDYRLNSQLLDFKQVFSCCRPSEIRLKLNVQIIKSGTHLVIASKEFSITEPTVHNTPYSGVFAANRASFRLLTQLSAWVLQQNLPSAHAPLKNNKNPPDINELILHKK